MNINLLPLATEAELLASSISENFRRLVDSVRNLNDTWSGTSPVTGSLTVTTGLRKVLYVTASFNSDPPSNDCLVVVGRPGVAPTDVLLKVFGWGSPSLVLSTTPINVTWIAYGF